MDQILVNLEDNGTVPAKPARSVWNCLWGVFSTLATFAAVIIGTLAVIVAVASHFSPPGQYTVFGHPVLSVLSGSMSPTIKTGDLVFDDPVSRSQAENLHAGQIITFRAVGTRTFTHRIHAVEAVNGSVFYQTKGDANNAPDQALVSPQQIVGLYSDKVPLGGYMLNALHKPAILMLLLTAPFLWLLSSWLLDLANEPERKAAAVLEREGAAVM